MYNQYYNLKENPFNVTSDPSFFFLSQKHKEAVSHLLYGVSQRKGIIVITGEIGAGKTTLCRYFLNLLGSKIKTSLILNPYFSELQLLEAIIKDFGINPKNKSRLSFIWELNKFLLSESEKGNNVVLIIDEAQNLSTKALEQIRLLSNIETDKDKLLQIVLTGQPQLNKKIDLYELRQLQQRITVRYHIDSLEEGEVENYINYRLNVAGSNDTLKFSPEAVKFIFKFSFGIPRLINIICDRALLAGYSAETHLIDLDIINHCAEELDYFLTPQG